MFDGLFAPQHLIVVLIIALLIFGPKRLPEIGRGLGKGIKEFKGTMNGMLEDETEKKEAKPEVKPAEKTETS